MKAPTRETEFEKKRGISRVEVRHGYAQVHVTGLTRNLMRERLRVLQAVADAGLSIDFLKLTPAGLSFILPEAKAEVAEQALHPTSVSFTINRGRSIVLVYAVNIRDEEGMIANILRSTITTCAQVDHVGDMHDRLLMVVRSEEVEAVVAQFDRAVQNGAELEVRS